MQTNNHPSRKTIWYYHFWKHLQRGLKSSMSSVIPLVMTVLVFLVLCKPCKAMAFLWLQNSFPTTSMRKKQRSISEIYSTAMKWAIVVWMKIWTPGSDYQTKWLRSSLCVVQVSVGVWATPSPPLHMVLMVNILSAGVPTAPSPSQPRSAVLHPSGNFLQWEHCWNGKEIINKIIQTSQIHYGILSLVEQSRSHDLGFQIRSPITCVLQAPPRNLQNYEYASRKSYRMHLKVFWSFVNGSIVGFTVYWCHLWDL